MFIDFHTFGSYRLRKAHALLVTCMNDFRSESLGKTEWQSNANVKAIETAVENTNECCRVLAKWLTYFPFWFTFASEIVEAFFDVVPR